MGGARALEWAVTYPERTRAALVLAVGARATADQIGTQTTQIAAIQGRPGLAGRRLPGTDFAPTTGMGVARRIAHLTYRTRSNSTSGSANSARATRIPLLDGRYAVRPTSTTRPRRSFPLRPGVLCRAHRGAQQPRRRAGARRRPRRVELRQTPVIVGGIDGDRLYPIRLLRRARPRARQLRGRPARRRVRVRPRRLPLSSSTPSPTSCARRSPSRR